MKRLIDLVMPMKFFATMMFFGLIALYVVAGMAQSIIANEAIEYAVPFIYILQSTILSLVFSVIWALFFSEEASKRWRFFIRYGLFAIIVFAALIISFFAFLAIPTEWAWTLLLVAVVVFFGVTVFLSVNEMYYRKTGERYMEMLNSYKKSIS